MKDYFKPRTWFITTFMFIIALGLSSATVYYEFGLKQNIKILNASTSDNVAGFAWNANIGWISFNCTNQVCVDSSKKINNSKSCVDGTCTGAGYSCRDQCKACNNDGSQICDNDSDCNGGACINNNYGVSLDPGAGSFKDFSGYAWSSSVGWISFNRSDTGNPPDNPYKIGSGPIARTDHNGQVDGWAKILTFKNICVGGANPGTLCPIGNECTGGGSCQSNGWIKLKKSIGSEPDYGVSANSSAPPTVENMIAPNWSYYLASTDIRGALHADLKFSYVNSSADGFSGWAWNANDDGSGIGWTSFNCSNVIKVCNGGTKTGTLCSAAGDCPGGSCADTQSSCNGGAKAGTPCVVVGDCPGGTCENTCTRLSNYKVSAGGISGGSSGQYYQIIVSKEETQQGQPKNPIFDSGKCTYPSPDPKCKIDISCLANDACQYSLGKDESLNYNTAYYWWVMVWDTNGKDSGWTQYNGTGSSQQDTPYPEADDGQPLTFTTYKHEFPKPHASYFVADPSRAEEVKFIATSSQRFFSAPVGNPNDPAPYTPVPCQDDSQHKTCDWLWTTNNVNDQISSPNASTTIIIFNNAGAGQIVTLTVTDNGDTGTTPYYSTISMSINVNAKLPNWKEVKPE